MTVVVPARPVGQLGDAWRTCVGTGRFDLALRRDYQDSLALLQREKPRPKLGWRDRVFWMWVLGWFADWRSWLCVVQPETVLRWHRAGFRLFWRWKSGGRPGRPTIPRVVIALIKQMARENVTWGAPRIRADLLEATEESFEEILRVNLQGPYFLSQAVARLLLERKRQRPGSPGAIVFVTSVSAVMASPNRGEYCVSKAGLAMAARLFAVRLGQLQGVAHDAEVLAVTALLHDLGLANGFTGQRRFEIEGADAARAFARQHGLDHRRQQLIWDGVALNSTPSISLYKEAEVALCTAGTALDFGGPQYDQIPPDEMRSVRRRQAEKRPDGRLVGVGLATYTAAFIAEIVRAGILAVDRGQAEAAHALGLSRVQAMRLVILPQALRVIVPPMTSQYLNLTKNSSLAVAIGYPDLVSIANTTMNQTGQAIEGVAVIMAVYLTISLSISAFMNWYNARVAWR